MQLHQRKGGKEKVVHCSKMTFTKEENKKGQGWCATKLTSRSEGKRVDFITYVGHPALLR